MRGETVRQQMDQTDTPQTNKDCSIQCVTSVDTRNNNINHRYKCRGHSRTFHSRHSENSCGRISSPQHRTIPQAERARGIWIAFSPIHGPTNTIRSPGGIPSINKTDRISPTNWKNVLEFRVCKAKVGTEVERFPLNAASIYRRCPRGGELAEHEAWRTAGSQPSPHHTHSLIPANWVLGVLGAHTHSHPPTHTHTIPHCAAEE